MIPLEQVREARALLGWSPKQLADEAALSIKTLEAFEEGRILLVNMHKTVLKDVLERAGVQFPKQKPKPRRRARTLAEG
jgi:ribosome-binding protein aMBF1 (putative translation factor)